MKATVCNKILTSYGKARYLTRTTGVAVRRGTYTLHGRERGGVGGVLCVRSGCRGQRRSRRRPGTTRRVGGRPGHEVVGPWALSIGVRMPGPCGPCGRSPVWIYLALDAARYARECG